MKTIHTHIHHHPYTILSLPQVVKNFQTYTRVREREEKNDQLISSTKRLLLDMIEKEGEKQRGGQS